ncbi:MAG: ubiquinone biosynthesis regulatory protein kinase UbiB [bacterium]
MSRVRRTSTILRVALRHRLDTFINANRVPGSVGRLLRLTSKLPEPTKPRGERLREALESLGPVFVKFGQILSTRPDLVPPDICEELDKLQDQVPPFSGEEFVTIVEGALKKSVDDIFAEFDRSPLASASVAQVHGAKLPDGKDVVVKVIRPGIGKVIQQDIDLMMSVARFLERHVPQTRRLHPVEIVRDYEHVIFDELNLQREAANTSLLRRNFEKSSLLYVPDVCWPLTNEKVLVMERIYATPVTDVAALQEKGTDFKVLAERGVEIFFTQVFDHNFFHADMHPGNIFVDASNPAEPSYLAVDCAIMGSLTEPEQYYLARNLLAIFRRDYRQVAELHIQSGWIAETTAVHDFAAAIRTVCEPIFQRPLREISFGQILVSLFRTAQRYDMEVQPSLVLLQKTLLNIEGLGRQLYPDLDLWQTAHPFLEKWLRERYRPDALVEQLKRYGPEWMEQFPQVPQMIFASLEKLQHQEFNAPRPPRKIEPVKPKRRSTRWLGVACLGSASAFGYLGGFDLAQMHPANLVLGCVGLALLLRDL